MNFEIVDTAEDFVVKTPNYSTPEIPFEQAVARLPASSPILTALESPHVNVHFGVKNGDVTVRQWNYSKEKYSRSDVEQILREKLFKCKRCTINYAESRVGEKRMAYVNYRQVGTEVLVAGIGGTLAGAIHFMWLSPQFIGQQIIPGLPTSSLIDFVVAFITGVMTKMYAKTANMVLLGVGATAFFFASGLIDILRANNLITFGTPMRFSAPITMSPQTAMVPRATYMAPPGVVLNKHGSVPQVAPGTFA